MPKPMLTEEQEILAAHVAATTAAFQVLVKCLEESGSLDRNMFPAMLEIYIQGTKNKTNPMVLSLLNDLRFALLH